MCAPAFVWPFSCSRWLATRTQHLDEDGDTEATPTPVRRTARMRVISPTRTGTPRERRDLSPRRPTAGSPSWRRTGAITTIHAALAASETQILLQAGDYYIDEALELTVAGTTLRGADVPARGSSPHATAKTSSSPCERHHGRQPDPRHRAVRCRGVRGVRRTAPRSPTAPSWGTTASSPSTSRDR